jgi:hypothetical protein
MGVGGVGTVRGEKRESSFAEYSLTMRKARRAAALDGFVGWRSVFVCGQH